MKNMQKFLRHSRKWSALLIGLIVTVFLSILVIGFLEKVLKVGQNAKAIEQSTAAYYLASGRIETKLGDLWKEIKTAPWNLPSDTKPSPLVNFSGSYLLAQTKTSTIPSAWKGNSPFDPDKKWNLMSLNDPVQIVIPRNVDWTRVKLFFRVPNIAKNENKNETRPATIDGTFALNNGIILWTFGNATKIIYAEPNQVLKKDSVQGVGSYVGVHLKDKEWYYYENNGIKNSNVLFSTFYNGMRDECGAADNEFKCTLKLSMISPIIANIWWNRIPNFPYLEYKIEFPDSTTIPEQFMTLNSVGYVDKYSRERIVRIPQITTNTALDFVVLQ